ncbi:MAG: hypothetical protein CTR55_09515 [Pseudomonas sp.]|uniref:hypothetical protein n=1 Tax=Pseudomonas sp. TaxID=306 RepID=UPI000CBD4F62|nr:hypothetical protein [Pseudomonas sp.]PJI49580.1 MAG: hypothetical protein CTR55_09515 [Pseudomonas sp.]
MESTARDRRIAVLIPVVSPLLLYVSFWSAPLLVLGYLLLRRRALPLAREVMLRVLDLLLSVLLFSVAAGLLIGSLGVVARDGEIELLELASRALIGLFGILVTVYAVISLGFSAFRAWHGQLHDPKLSMGVLQALRGRPRTAA